VQPSPRGALLAASLQLALGGRCACGRCCSFKHIAVIPATRRGRTRRLFPWLTVYIEVQGPDRVTTTRSRPRPRSAHRPRARRSRSPCCRVGPHADRRAAEHPAGVSTASRTACRFRSATAASLLQRQRRGVRRGRQLAQDGSGQVTSAAMQFYCLTTTRAPSTAGGVFNIVRPRPPRATTSTPTTASSRVRNDNYLDYLGDLSGRPERPIVGMAITPDGGGYWSSPPTAASSATATQFLRLDGWQALERPDRRHGDGHGTGGYWLVASDAGVRL